MLSVQAFGAHSGFSGLVVKLWEFTDEKCFGFVFRFLVWGLILRLARQYFGCGAKER